MTPRTAPARPFAAGSISVGLFRASAEADRAARELVADAQAAEELGFDGVTVGEHHRGLPGYLPNPLQACEWMLAQTRRIWVAPCPLLLPLRVAPILCEEVAWSVARHGDRIGLGLARGYLAEDFEFADVPVAESFERWTRGLSHVSRLLTADDRSVAAPADPALEMVRRRGIRIPVLCAAGGLPAVERAARLGFGLIMNARPAAPSAAELISHFRACGGVGPVMGTRAVWIGDGVPPLHALAQQAWRTRGLAIDETDPQAAAHLGVAAGPADVVADRLRAELEHVDLLNVRFAFPGVTADEGRRQMALFAERVLDDIRGERSAPR